MTNSTSGFGARSRIASVASIISVLAALAFFVPGPVFAAGSTWYVDASAAAGGDGHSAATAFQTIQAAVTAASAGDTIDVSGTQSVTSAINVNIPLTIEGSAGAEIDTTGSGYVFSINPGAAGTTVTGLTFKKTDTVGNDAMVLVNADNVTISSNTFKSPFNIGDSETIRGLDVSGVTGLNIHDNTFSHLRQPAYINNATGSATDNYTEVTKGWVVVSESHIAFTGNTWGTDANANTDDLVFITDTPVGTDNYSDVSSISQANSNGFVLDKASAPFQQSSAYVDSSTGDDTADGSASSPLKTIDAALTRVAAGGTVHLAAGTYSGPLTITKDGVSVIGTGAVTVNEGTDDAFGYGATVDHASNVTISGINFSAASLPAGYAFHAYRADGLTLKNLDFTGPGSSSSHHVGGVDINTSSNVNIDSVASSGFYKNGFSVTAQNASTDPASSNIAFSDISSTDNGWDGVAFYTMNNSGSAGSDITGVSFTGSNTVSGNGQGGIFLEGDTDANALNGVTPRYTVTTDGTTLDLTHVAFGQTGLLFDFDINNYQTAPVNAIGATFEGKTGDAMTSFERGAVDTYRINDQLDHAAYGLVTYYAYVNDTTQSNFVGSPSYVRANTAGDVAAIALVPSQATAARFTFKEVGGSNTYADVAGTEHLQAGQFPVPSTGQHQYRVGTALPAGTYTVTGEYEVSGTWYPITGTATAYALGLPTGSFIIPSATASTFRPGDNPLRISADDTDNAFRDVVFQLNGTDYQVNRADCDLREAGNRVLCDISKASNWTDLADGTYAATATLYNDASNHAQITSQNFVVSDVRPTLSNFEITNQMATYGSEIDVQADATDATGIQNVEFYVTAPRAADGACDGNGTALTSKTVTSGTGSTYSAALDTSALTGDYCVNAIAENSAASHSNPVQSLKVSISNPVITPVGLTTPSNGAPNGTTLNTNDFDFTWDASTGTTSPISYDSQFTQDPTTTNGVLTNNLWASTTPTNAIHSSGAGDGIWYWQVRAEADGMHSDWSPVWSVTLDTTGAATPTPAANVTTGDATNVSDTDATLNGTNGPSDADGHSFWVSTSTIDTSSPSIPADVYSTPDMGAIASSTSFSALLSSLTTNAVTTGGAAGSMPALVPGTTYHYVAWSHVSGTWYPGDEKTVTLSANGQGGGSPSGNSAPTANPQSVGVTQDKSVDITLTGSDPDGNSLTYSIATAPANGTLSAITGADVTYTPSAGYSGSDSFTFVANDGTTDSQPATVSITVNASPTPPTPPTPSTLVVTPSAPQGWAEYGDAASGATTFISAADASNAAGALKLATSDDVNSITHFKKDVDSTLLSDVDSISYDTKQLAATTSDQTVANATLRLSIDLDGDGQEDDQLMYEPYYNGFSGSTDWNTWTITDSQGKFWSNNSLTYNGLGGVSAGSYASNFTLADVLHDHPDAKLLGVILSMGTYNVSQQVAVDNVHLVTASEDTTYEFEPDAASTGGTTDTVTSNSRRRGSTFVAFVPSSTGTSGGQVLGAAAFNFTRDLYFGLSGADVTELQTELIAAGYSIPAGATGWFGPQTRAAVAQWQAEHGITPAAGYFGPISRAKYTADGGFKILTTPVTTDATTTASTTTSA